MLFALYFCVVIAMTQLYKSSQMNQVFLVYKTDVHHSYASRDVIGIATSPAMAICICQEQARKEHGKINKEQLFNLTTLQQTQGYKGAGEFQFESITTDILL